MEWKMSEPLPAPIRVLVVEDEFLIRLTLSEALGDEGFEVLEAETGDAALPMLAPGCGISLLLTDIQLPGSLNGRALVERVRRTMPGLPVIYMTGRPDPDGEAPASPLDVFIAKPYTLTAICDAAKQLTACSASST
jgi:CheY-like chemotaxis protein